MAVLAAEQKCRCVGFGAILIALKFIYSGPPTGLTLEGEMARSGLGVKLMRRREFLSGCSAARRQANKPYRIGDLSLCAAPIPTRFPTIRLPNSNCLSTSRPPRH